MWIRISYNADPDPAFFVNADPDTDPDPGFFATVDREKKFSDLLQTNFFHFFKTFKGTYLSNMMLVQLKMPKWLGTLVLLSTFKFKQKKIVKFWVNTAETGKLCPRKMSSPYLIKLMKSIRFNEPTYVK
jgi:hypothetical protein